MLKYRLYWYQQKVFAKLVRFKHAIIIMIALFVPTMSWLNSLITQPILSVVAVTATTHAYLVLVLLIQLIYLGWISIQSDAIYPDIVQSYLATLPLPARQRRIEDIVMLFIANNIFWIPFVAAYFSLSHSAAPLSGLSIVRLCAFMMSIISSQYLWLNRRLAACVVLFAVDFLLFANRAYPSVIIPVIAIVISVMPLLYPDLVVWKRRLLLPSGEFNTSIVNKFPVVGMSWLILWRNYRIDLTTRMLIVLGVIILASALVLKNQTFSSIQIDVAATAIMTLVWSGVYPLLKETRDACSLYLHSLPIAWLKWYAMDCCVLLTMSGLSLLFYTSLLFINHVINISAIAYTVLTIVILGILLLYPRCHYSKQGTLISIALTIIYILLVGWFVK